MTETTEVERTICEHCGLTLGWPCANQYEAAHCLNHVANLRAKRDSLRDVAVKAEAALADIAEGEPDPDDMAERIWCKDRAAEILPIIRAALTGEDKP